MTRTALPWLWHLSSRRSRGSLPPNVLELLGQMVHSAGENLIPLLRNVGRRLKGSELAGDQHIEDMMDRTLKSFDQLKDLAEALRKIDTRRVGG